MPVFADKRAYGVSIVAKDDGIYLISSDIEQKLETKEEINEYMTEFSLNGGYFANTFRRVQYPDGNWKFRHSNHEDFKEAKKKERIKASDLNSGDVLIDKYNSQYIYIGSFYRKIDSKITHFFQGSRGYHNKLTSLEKFVDVIDFDGEYLNRLKNFNNLASRDQRQYSLNKE